MFAIGTFDYTFDYIDDDMVNDCIMSMYFYMLCDSSLENKKEEYFKEFEDKYQKLNDEQKELVQKDYLQIIEAQDRNRNKVKRKGDKYE